MGRLKIREGTIENCLVWYERENTAGPKPCRFQIIKFQKHDFRLTELKALLSASLGVSIRVIKTREIYFTGNVKIYLDTVPDLGTFIEIEAFETDSQNPESLRKQCDTFFRLLGIRNDQLVSKSYADLMEKPVSKPVV